MFVLYAPGLEQALASVRFPLQKGLEGANIKIAVNGYVKCLLNKHPYSVYLEAQDYINIFQRGLP